MELTTQLRELIAKAINDEAMEFEEIADFCVDAVSDIPIEEVENNQYVVGVTLNDITSLTLQNVPTDTEPVDNSYAIPSNVYLVSSYYQPEDLVANKKYNNIKTAYDAAPAGTLIKVLPGTYTISSTITMKAGVTIWFDKGTTINVTTVNGGTSTRHAFYRPDGTRFDVNILGHGRFNVTAGGALLYVFHGDYNNPINLWFEFDTINDSSSMNYNVLIDSSVTLRLKGRSYVNTFGGGGECCIYTNLTFGLDYLDQMEYLSNIISIKNVDVVKCFYDAEDHFIAMNNIFRNMTVVKSSTANDGVFGSTFILGDDTNEHWYFNIACVNKSTGNNAWGWYNTLSRHYLINCQIQIASATAGAYYTDTSVIKTILLGSISNKPTTHSSTPPVAGTECLIDTDFTLL